ncbi:MAG: hypothetical protein HY558_06720 [Euryarchaeota archaeon]|nr:hypothetical protein [Euryarchaeota archaeon]
MDGKPPAAAKSAPPRHTTGISFLDQLLGGGLPLRSIVVFLTDPVSGADQFLYLFATTRKTYYFSTEKRPQDIQRSMEELNLLPREVVFISGDKAKYLLAQNLEPIRKEKDVNLIIDSFSFFLKAAGDVEKVRKILNLIRDVTLASDAIAFLSIYKGTHSKELENAILNTSDVVFDIESHIAGDRNETILSIPKIKGMAPVGRMRVTIGEKIKIDTSRDIA